MAPSVNPMQAPTQPSMEEEPLGMPQEMQQTQRSLGLLDRLRNGIELPDKPTHYKNRGSQNFLRGLVHGFKQGGPGGPTMGAAGGRSGGAAVGPDGLTAYQRASLQYRQSADERAAAASDRQARGLESLLKDRETDNARQEKQFTMSREDEAFDRQMAMRGMSIRERELALSQRREARMAEADRIGKAGVNPKWPESWKLERAGVVEGLKAKLAYQKDYTPNDFMRDIQAVNDVYAEREFRLFGGQSGSSTTAPVKGR